MIKYNLIRVITFISILVLFFAQSVYDPSVHAKMQRMEDESLSEINAAALNADLNLTVRAVVTSLFRVQDPRTYDSINFSALEISNGTSGTGFTVNTTMSWDLGARSVGTDRIGKTWIVGTNIEFPYNNRGLAITANNPYFVDNITYLPMGNSIRVSGISFGQNVDGTPNLRPTWQAPFTSPWVIISSAGSAARGLEFYMEIAGYVHNVTYFWNNNNNDAGSVRLGGVYIYGMGNDTANPINVWPQKGGAMKLGGAYPTYNVTSGTATGTQTDIYQSIDLGSNPTVGSRVFMNMPVAGTIRIRNFYFGNTNWGPLAADDLVFYENRITFRDLNRPI